jgi:hypothetical protein
LSKIKSQKAHDVEEIEDSVSHWISGIGGFRGVSEVSGNPLPAAGVFYLMLATCVSA